MDRQELRDLAFEVLETAKTGDEVLWLACAYQNASEAVGNVISAECEFATPSGDPPKAMTADDSNRLYELTKIAKQYIRATRTEIERIRQRHRRERSRV